MTYRPSELAAALDVNQPVAILVAANAPGSLITVSSSNNVATFRITPAGSPASTDLSFTFPSGPYRDGVMAALAVSTVGLPVEFTAVSGRTAIVLKGAWEGASIEYVSGTATWLGFTAGQSAVAASPPPGSYLPALTGRVEALEDGGGGGGGASPWTKGGSLCWHVSPTGTVSTGTLGYSSGAGVAGVCPMYVKSELSFSKMMLEIGTVYTTACIYTCIVLDDAGLDYDYPGTILAKVDIDTTTSGGAKSASITPITLPAGDYWIGLGISAVEGAGGALVMNTGIGLVQPYAPTGTARSGNARNPAGWLTTNYEIGAVGTSWPARSASGMDTYYRIPRVGLWAG